MLSRPDRPSRRTATSPLRLATGTTAVGALVALTAGPAAAVAPADAGLLRLTHVAAGTATVDVTLSPFSSSEAVTVPDLEYGEVTDYQRLAPGFYAASIRPADRPDAPPVLSADVQVTEGGAATVVVSGSGAQPTAAVLPDDLSPPPAGQARVRLLQGATTAPTVDVRAVDGPVIAEDVAYGSATGYATVPAGPWTLRIEPDSGPAEAAATQVVLEPGSVQTLLVLDEAPGLTARGVSDEAPAGGAGMTARRVVDAEGMARMPTGGVQTGAGSTAASPAASPGAGAPGPAAVVAVAALAGAAGAVVAARGRPTTAAASPGSAAPPSA